MTAKHVTEKHHATFDGIRHLDEDGNEFWLARQLNRILEYSEFRHVLPVVEREFSDVSSGRPELVEGHSELVNHGLRLFDKLTAQPERVMRT
ncbi:MAG: hypothetical protein ACOX5Z_08195 [Desulfobulbus sp.]|jgi:DNA-damage-inducible protein D